VLTEAPLAGDQPTALASDRNEPALRQGEDAPHVLLDEFRDSDRTLKAVVADAISSSTSSMLNSIPLMC
jgi:hypothetical protein